MCHDTIFNLVTSNFNCAMVLKDILDKLILKFTLSTDWWWILQMFDV
jgi:hypothetical protein